MLKDFLFDRVALIVLLLIVVLVAVAAMFSMFSSVILVRVLPVPFRVVTPVIILVLLTVLELPSRVKVPVTSVLLIVLELPVICRLSLMVQSLIVALSALRITVPFVSVKV